MYVLAPLLVTDSVLTASSLPETDHAAWASGTAYAVGDRAIIVTSTLPKSTAQAWVAGQSIYWDAVRSLASTTLGSGGYIGVASADVAAVTATGVVAVHSVYEAVAASTGVDPVRDAAGTSWVRVGATNRWRAFDETVGDRASGVTDITYELTLPSLTTGLALFGLRAASVTVAVRNLSDVVVHTETRDLASTEDITDWFTFFTWDPRYETEALFVGLPGYAGYKLDITVSGAEPAVGEVVAGPIVNLGRTMAGTEIGFEDFSRKERDEWGNIILIEREYSDTVGFRFAVDKTDLRRVKRIVSELRARPAVWFAGADIINRGATIYGFPAAGLRVPLEAEGFHFATLEIEGLT